MKIKLLVAMTAAGLALTIQAQGTHDLPPSYEEATGAAPKAHETEKPVLNRKKTIGEQIAEKAEKRPTATVGTTLIDIVKLINGIKADSTGREQAHCFLILDAITSVIHDFSDLSAKYFSNRSKELKTLAEDLDAKLKKGDMSSFTLVTGTVLPIVSDLVGTLRNVGALPGDVATKLQSGIAKAQERSKNCSGMREVERALEGL